jgi:hypothetical protein
MQCELAVGMLDSSFTTVEPLASQGVSRIGWLSSEWSVIRKLDTPGTAHELRSLLSVNMFTSSHLLIALTNG